MPPQPDGTNCQKKHLKHPQKSKKPTQTTPKNTPATMPQMLKIKIFSVIKHYKTTQYKITIKIIEKYFLYVKK